LLLGRSPDTGVTWIPIRKWCSDHSVQLQLFEEPEPKSLGPHHQRIRRGTSGRRSRLPPALALSNSTSMKNSNPVPKDARPISETAEMVSELRDCSSSRISKPVTRRAPFPCSGAGQAGAIRRPEPRPTRTQPPTPLSSPRLLTPILGPQKPNPSPPSDGIWRS
jgi:hypothetical protein